MRSNGATSCNRSHSRDGTAEQVALRQARTEVGEQVALRDRLDTLGDPAQPELGREAGDRAHDRQVVRLEVHPGDERAVDLQVRDGEAAQVGQRRVAGAEVVEADHHAAVAQIDQLRDRRLVGLEQRRLGQLERQRRLRQSGRLERGAHGRGEVGAGRLPRGEVDRDS